VNNRFQAVLGAIALPICSAAFVVSWSRSAWLALVVGAITLLLQKRTTWKRVFPVVLVGFIALALYFPLFQTRASTASVTEARSIAERQTGVSLAFQLVSFDRPFGVGLGNYTAALHEEYPTLPGYALQPVHVIPLLILVEIGWLGILLFGSVSYAMSSQNIRLSKRLVSVFIFFIPLLLLDHYLWTTYQGVLMGGVFLALFFTSPQLFHTKSTTSPSV
jgi:O-antigen ligase